MKFEKDVCPICESELEIVNDVYINAEYDGYLELKCAKCTKCDCELDYDI